MLSLDFVEEFVVVAFQFGGALGRSSNNFPWYGLSSPGAKYVGIRSSLAGACSPTRSSLAGACSPNASFALVLAQSLICEWILVGGKGFPRSDSHRAIRVEMLIIKTSLNTRGLSDLPSMLTMSLSLTKAGILGRGISKNPCRVDFRAYLSVLYFPHFLSSSGL